jgi:hypothetical protein
VPATRKRKSKNVAPTLAGALSEIGQRHAAIRAQRVADYVRLDSPVLAKLISAGKKGVPGAPEVVQAAQPSETVENEDWDVED